MYRRLLITRVMLMLGLSLFALLMGGADGGGCSSSMDPMNAIPACMTSLIDPNGVMFACNMPKQFSDPDFLAKFPNSPACGVMFCNADLDGAYAHADQALGLDAVTAANRGLRCILVGGGYGDLARFQAPPAWNQPGGCVQPANDVDAGVPNDCSEVAYSCARISDCCEQPPGSDPYALLLCGSKAENMNYPGFCCWAPDAPCGNDDGNDYCCVGACLPTVDEAGFRCGCYNDGEECIKSRECCYPSICDNGFCTPQ